MNIRVSVNYNYIITFARFLVDFSNSSVVPKFLDFRVATKSLKCSRTYQQCQLNLLQEDIRQKKSDIKSVKKTV